MEVARGLQQAALVGGRRGGRLGLGLQDGRREAHLPHLADAAKPVGQRRAREVGRGMDAAGDVAECHREIAP